MTLVDSQQHTAVPPTPQEREEELEADILAAQLQYGLDIQDRDPENPVDPDYPDYQQIIAGAIILGQDVPALPPLANPEPDPEDPPIPAAIQGHQAIVAFLPPNAPGAPAPTPVPVLAMAHQQAGDAKLRGLPPALFNGNCKKSEDFLCKFQLFQGLNENHELMTNPYFQSMLALSYMRGPNIKDWVEDQANDLRTKTTRAINPINCAEEVLWTDFLATFNRTFTDTTRQQTAYHQLYQWKMQKDDLDNYYSRFQHLATHAGFDRNARTTIDLFAKGLKPQLLQAILNRDNTPNMMDEWITAA